MPVVLDSQVKTIIADDQTEVDDKLHDLMAAWEVTNSEVTELEITPFGACKFLITLLFSGPFVKKALLGLLSDLGRALAMNRVYDATEGLTLSIGNTVSYTRVGSPMLGLLPAGIARALAIGREVSTTLGVLAATPSYTQHDVHQAYTYSPTSGLTSLIDRDIATARAAGAPGLGLVLDISISWYRP